MHTEQVISSQSFLGMAKLDFFSLHVSSGYGVALQCLEAILRLPLVPFAIFEIDLL